LAELKETHEALNQITTIAVKRQTYIDRCSAYVTVDDSVYPSKVAWANGIPSAAPDVAAREEGD